VRIDGTQGEFAARPKRYLFFPGQEGNTMKSRQKQHLTFSVLFAAVIFCAMPLVVHAQAQSPLVFTFSGPVRGTVTSADVREFLGIPYAAPPVGNLRWRPPVAHAPWFAPLEATNFANHCPQPPSPFGRASITEDCLFLNVFTPSSADFFHPRPVMVWIHGGALVTGESDDYDPTALVEDGVIVVTINYRLGALGFFAHPAFAAESTDADRDRDIDSNSAGDYGLMDQQLALRWVRDNILFFGGDPLNVTIFGESAGGLSVFSQLVSPPADGLFHKAIIESGAYALNTQTLDTAEAAGTAFATAAGCSSQTSACLRALPVTTILANENPAGYTPNIDGEFFPLSLNTALATGQFHRVPVIQGSNHDEWRLHSARFRSHHRTHRQQRGRVRSSSSHPGRPRSSPRLRAISARQFPFCGHCLRHRWHRRRLRVFGFGRRPLDVSIRPGLVL
jgi:para-nitrobenzyl esterase